MTKDFLDNTITSTDNNIIKTHEVNIKFHPHGLGDFFYHLMLNNSSNIAQIDGLTNQAQTYEHLLSRCVKTAQAMRKLGVIPGDLITPITHNHLDSCVPFISCLFTGAFSAPLDLAMPKDEMKDLLDVFEPKIIFCSTEAENFLETKIVDWGIKSEIVVFGESKNHTSFEEFLDFGLDSEKFEVYKVKSLLDTAYISLTGGSTGKHKAACITHLSMFNFVYSNTHSFETNSTIISFSPLLWVLASVHIGRSITWGYCRVILPKFDPKTYFTILKKYNIYSSMISSSSITQLLKETIPKDLDLSFLKCLQYMGSPLSTVSVKQLRKLLPNTIISSAYGQTEVGGHLAYFDWGKHPYFYKTKPFSVGRPVKGLHYKVVDINTGEVLGPNKHGHLLVKSQFKMNGYYKRDSSNVFDEDGWIKTGDIVYYDEDYFFYFVDRMKEMMRYRTWAISPLYLEEILLTHSSVEFAFVTGIPNDEDGDHPVGAVVLKDGKKMIGKELERLVNERVDETRKIRAGVWIVKRDFVPYSASGKVMRYEFRRKLLEMVQKDLRSCQNKIISLD